jgi:hypothetical protein
MQFSQCQTEFHHLEPFQRYTAEVNSDSMHFVNRKDEWTLPGNLQNGKYSFLSPSCVVSFTIFSFSVLPLSLQSSKGEPVSRNTSLQVTSPLTHVTCFRADMLLGLFDPEDEDDGSPKFG